VILTTERLTLRELTEADAEQLYHLNANPNVTRFVSEPALPDVAAALAILRDIVFPQYRAYGCGRWAVLAREDGAFLGWCGLKYLPDSGDYDIGYRFFEHAWGHGYATEAAAACIRWGRQRFPGARIVGRAIPDNARSIRVLGKLGLRFVRLEHEGGETLALYAL